MMDKSNNAVGAFKKVSATSYRKYTESDGTYTYSGAEIEGNWLGEIIPLFEINSAFFTKSTSETGDVYTFKGYVDEMYIYPCTDIFCGFGKTIGTAQYISTFTITIRDDSVAFHNEVGVFTTDVTFSSIGQVTALSRNIAEPAE